MRAYLADLAHTQSVADSSLTVPLNIGYVKAHAVATHGDAVDVRLFKHPERLLEAAMRDRPEVVGLAAYGWNENLNRAVGRHLRAHLPETVLVAGGPNIDPAPDERVRFLERHPYLDFLVIDAGEEPFSALLGWLGGDARRREDLPVNVMWLEAGRLLGTEATAPGKRIAGIPSPYLGGHLDEFLAAGMVPLLETNRGCPFKCTFCAWGAASKDLVRRFDLDQALAEIEYVGERARARNWIVCDANFGILKRDVEIARAIRGVRERTGLPLKCHIWLAKNVTERNLEIGAILGDMTVPVMAVQSLDEEVLASIKRDNISTETYVEYQRRFHEIGSRTYSDLIVPLPSETLESHLRSLASLFDYGVDIIQSHSMRLLAGAEVASADSRARHGFRTRYRLIHGDAGEYRAPGGETLRVFEYEESLRSTATFDEASMFYLRKLHFLVDFCWNIEVYKPLLAALAGRGVNQVDVLRRLIELGEAGDPALGDGAAGVRRFFERFDALSHEEWFESEAHIEAFFAEEENWRRLIGREFEKLNVLFSVILLKEHKRDFDAAMLAIAGETGRLPAATLDAVFEYTRALFPPLDAPAARTRVRVPPGVEGARPDALLELEEGERRLQLRDLLADSGGQTLSKILNTQMFSLADLRMSVRAPS